MRTEYKRDVHNNYLVLQSDEVVDTSSYQVRMLLANAIPALLKCRLQNMDGQVLYYYDITSRQSLDTIYEGKKFRFEDLQLIFGEFVKVMEKMAEYLLNPDHLLLQPEYIYLDVENRNLFVCYLPGYEKSVREQFQMLTEYVLPKLDHEDNRAVILGYGVYRRALEDVFQLEHIKEEVYRAQETAPTESAADSRQKSNIRNPKEVQMESQADLNSLFGDEEEKEMDAKSEKTRLKEILKILLMCIAAAASLSIILIAGYAGYLPIPPVEVLLGGILLLAGIISLCCYMHVQKKKEKDGESWQKKDYRLDMGYDQEAEPEKPCRKQKITGDVNGRTEGREEYQTENQGENRKEDQREKSKEGQREKWQESRENNEKNPDRNYVWKNPDVSNDCGETVVLCEKPMAGPASLVSREPGELATIYLKEDLTVIGKLETAADAVIDMPTVSRLHAKIRRKDGEYFLTDLNSKNGTSVNGRMLKGDEEYLLQEEDEVDFAQARYVFLK